MKAAFGPTRALGDRVAISTTTATTHIAMVAIARAREEGQVAPALPVMRRMSTLVDHRSLVADDLVDVDGASPDLDLAAVFGGGKVNRRLGREVRSDRDRADGEGNDEDRREESLPEAIGRRLGRLICQVGRGSCVCHLVASVLLSRPGSGTSAAIDRDRRDVPDDQGRVRPRRCPVSDNSCVHCGPGPSVCEPLHGRDALHVVRARSGGLAPRQDDRASHRSMSTIAIECWNGVAASS